MSKAITHGNNLPLEILGQLRSGWAAMSKSVSTFAQRRARFNATYNELAALSDRDLADVGIARSQIAKLAKQEAMKLVLR